MKLQKSNSTFVPAPEGTTQGVLCDVVDLGYLEDKFNPGQTVHKMRLVFQTEDTTEEGVPFTVSTYPITASLNPKATLYGFVNTLIGRELAKEDYDDDGEIDLDALLIGRNAMIDVSHTEKGEKIYANVVAISSIPKKITERLEVSSGYVRDQDREKRDFSGPETAEAEVTEAPEEAKAATAGGKKDKIPF